MPSATPVVPRRNGRPKLSVTTIADVGPLPRARRAAARADASGSTGSRIARSAPEAFERSTPADGADEAVARLADEERPTGTHDARRLLRGPAR